ncbi:MAG: hypothetical protein IT371_02110 [Deltaproteobacteria bacterium]|nr:hypothetical protein [Deltaproteobacteria bacterium]
MGTRLTRRLLPAILVLWAVLPAYAAPAQLAGASPSPLDGLRAGAVVRPQQLYRHRAQNVVDAHYDPQHAILRRGVQETPFDGLKLFPIRELFAGPNEVFLGFGKPNVYLTIPSEDRQGYVKFAAFMFRRQAAYVADTKGRVQSGVLVRFRGLPEHAVTALRTAMTEHAGDRHWSCANANGRVLATAGFTSGGKGLGRYYRPTSLFRRILDAGLEFEGRPVQLDFIRTTAEPLEDYIASVAGKELSSPFRLVQKLVQGLTSRGKKEHAPAPILAPRELEPAPVDAAATMNSTTRLRLSHPSRLGAVLRRVWGQHVLWEAVPDRAQVAIDAYLPDRLVAFPKREANLFTRLKRDVLFSRRTVRAIRDHLARRYDDVGTFTPQALAAMMLPHTEARPRKYNLVITGDRIVVTLLDVKKKAVDWVLSKHVLLSGYSDDVRFAGEAWIEHQESGYVLHLNNNSGSYQPTPEQLVRTGQMLEAACPGLKVLTHPVGG